jgi:hypothetical protein
MTTGGGRSTRAPAPVTEVTSGTGRPGGTRVATVCFSRAGMARRLVSGMSMQTTPVAELGIVVSGAAGEAINEVAAVSSSPE